MSLVEVANGEIVAIHPAAAVWPMLSDAELQALADDIAENGLIDPITTDDDSRVLDGRNRLAACAIAGVPPSFTTVTVADDVEAAAFIIGRNAARRHMTPSQIAAATAKTLAVSGLRKPGRWTYGTVESGKSSTSAAKKSMAKAGTVLDYAPELLDSVIAGVLIDTVKSDLRQVGQFDPPELTDANEAAS